MSEVAALPLRESLPQPSQRHYDVIRPPENDIKAQKMRNAAMAEDITRERISNNLSPQQRTDLRTITLSEMDSHFSTFPNDYNAKAPAMELRARELQATERQKIADHVQQLRMDPQRLGELLSQLRNIVDGNNPTQSLIELLAHENIILPADLQDILHNHPDILAIDDLVELPLRYARYYIGLVRNNTPGGLEDAVRVTGFTEQQIQAISQISSGENRLDRVMQAAAITQPLTRVQIAALATAAGIGPENENQVIEYAQSRGLQIDTNDTYGRIIMLRKQIYQRVFNTIHADWDRSHPDTPIPPTGPITPPQADVEHLPNQPQMVAVDARQVIARIRPDEQAVDAKEIREITRARNQFDEIHYGVLQERVLGISLDQQLTDTVRQARNTISQLLYEQALGHQLTKDDISQLSYALTDLVKANDIHYIPPLPGTVDRLVDRYNQMVFGRQHLLAFDGNDSYQHVTDVAYTTTLYDEWRFIAGRAMDTSDPLHQYYVDRITDIQAINRQLAAEAFQLTPEQMQIIESNPTLRQNFDELAQNLPLQRENMNDIESAYDVLRDQLRMRDIDLRNLRQGRNRYQTILREQNRLRIDDNGDYTWLNTEVPNQQRVDRPQVLETVPINATVDITPSLTSTTSLADLYRDGRQFVVMYGLALQNRNAQANLQQEATTIFQRIIDRTPTGRPVANQATEASNLAGRDIDSIQRTIQQRARAAGGQEQQLTQAVRDQAHAIQNRLIIQGYLPQTLMIIEQRLGNQDILRTLQSRFPDNRIQLTIGNAGSTVSTQDAARYIGGLNYEDQMLALGNLLLPNVRQVAQTADMRPARAETTSGRYASLGDIERFQADHPADFLVLRDSILEEIVADPNILEQQMFHQNLNEEQMITGMMEYMRLEPQNPTHRKWLLHNVSPEDINHPNTSLLILDTTVPPIYRGRPVLLRFNPDGTIDRASTAQMWRTRIIPFIQEQTGINLRRAQLEVYLMQFFPLGNLISTTSSNPNN